ncbi:MAG: MBOAT family protein [Muribaculaceae bacterium]|nr:MBOAT family protein [Muribaculaceae bacterium]
MQFDSYSYALFLPLVFVIYWGLRERLRWQNVFLLAASYLFYGSWNWRMLGLIVLTTLTTWGTALLMRGDRSRHDRLLVTLNLVLNLGVLATFKYLDFMLDSLVSLLGALGIGVDWPTLHLLLPVGISFYTFQAVSYSIDVYRGEVKATRDVVAFAVYIAFFPQLVAGPIERASNLLPQFLRKKQFDYATAVLGMRQILWGVAKKVLVADFVGGYVDRLLYNPYGYAAPSMVWAGILFAVQIYADFSGYSDIAIGSARLLNIKLQPNFRYPFFSRGMRELWQRWHVSLMTWFRHYVYFPLGGSRCGRWRTALNVMVVFALSGLWHGADWTFVLWGTVNGLLLLPSVFLPRRRHAAVATWRDLPRCVMSFMLFAAALLIFRSHGLWHLTEIVDVLVNGSWRMRPVFGQPIFSIVPFFLIEWLGRRHEFPLAHLPFPRAVRWLLYWVLLAGISIGGLDRDMQFIYFQF